MLTIIRQKPGKFEAAESQSMITIYPTLTLQCLVVTKRSHNLKQTCRNLMIALKFLSVYIGVMIKICWNMQAAFLLSIDGHWWRRENRFWRILTFDGSKASHVRLHGRFADGKKWSLINCVPNVLMCQCALCVYVLTCRCALRAYVLTCQRVLRT